MLAYSPLWEPLSSALARIVLSGLAEPSAKSELASAIAERQVAIRVMVQSADPDVGSQVLDSGSVSVPKDLTDRDLDWLSSRPNAAWQTGPSIVEGYKATWRWNPRPIEWVEVSTDDVTRIWCADGERFARRAAAQAEPILDLPEWFSAMEAIAWIVTRDPRKVSHADPERAVQRTFFVEHHLPNGERIEANDGAGPGLTLGWLDGFAATNARTTTDSAVTEFMKSLKTGRVVARAIWVPTGERKDMGTDEWRNLALAPGENKRVLLPYRTIPGKLGQHLETRWQDILFPKNALVALWPLNEPCEPSNEASIVGTIAAERKLTAWLTDLMRGKPDKPISKAAVKVRAGENGYTFGQRGFQRAWANAVLASAASKWAKPGRKS